MTLDTIDLTGGLYDEDGNQLQAVSAEVPLYHELRRKVSRADQDWEDRVHDSVIFMLEHSGELPNELGEMEPIKAPIALAINHVKGRIRNARRKLAIRPAVSLDAPAADGKRGIADTLASASRTDARAIIHAALRRIPRRERAVFALIQAGHTQAEVARRLKVAQPMIHRLAARALENMAR